MEIILNWQDQTMSQSPKIPASAWAIADLLSFDQDYSFEIPDYQRPYVWSEKNINALLNDLFNHFKDGPQAHKGFYIGAILLHQVDHNKYAIIDGQQRITTLLIIDYVLNDGESIIVTKEKHLKLYFGARRSKENIHLNKNTIRQSPLLPELKKHRSELLKNIVATVIITESQDDAFIFFDTQNSRGKNLGAIDFLKSFHLRSLSGNLDLQKGFARDWDRDNSDQFLQTLFTEVLWRARHWRGWGIIDNNEENEKELLLNEFQQRSVKIRGGNEVPIYPGLLNTQGTHLRIHPGRDMEIVHSATGDINECLRYPFSLRQPIQQGAGFFLYAQKYATLYHYLFDQEKNVEAEVAELRRLYCMVYKPLISYLRQFFELCVVAHYDRFGPEKLLTLGLWMDYLIGSYRIAQSRITRQTPIKILRDNEINLLDLVTSAYRPEDVAVFITSISNEKAYKEEAVETGRGVRGRYKQSILSYFGKAADAHLSDKKNWIYARLQP